MITLAERKPDIWSLTFDTDEEANIKLEERKITRQKLTIAIEFSLQAERKRLEAKNKTDIWLNITWADFNCLINQKPARVAAAYKTALQNGQDFHKEAVLKQLSIYQQLNVVSENVHAAMNAIAPVKSLVEVKSYFLLFTGHMIDKVDRKEPRFPKEIEPEVREKIKAKITEEKNKINGAITGIAGGACGGDILFHEVCKELGIQTELYLVLPPEKFKKESVAFAGTNWIERFDKLYQTIPHHILCDTEELPAWLQKKEDYTIWERNNLWELNSSLINGGMNMTLIALWDGKGGDGAGGTQDMVNEANERGAKTIVIAVF